jgi:hypothetical protein
VTSTKIRPTHVAFFDSVPEFIFYGDFRALR